MSAKNPTISSHFMIS